MIRILTIVSVVFALFVEVNVAYAQDNNVQEGVVKIISLGPVNRQGYRSVGSGTGFILNKEGWVATNYHVIDGGEIFYILKDGAKVSRPDLATRPNAEIKFTEPDLDLAVLKFTDVENEVLSPVALAGVVPEKGLRVRAIGYPGAAGDNDVQRSSFEADATITEGVLGRDYTCTWGKNSPPLRCIQHSAEVSWGNSGGPLMDSCGRVIGVNTQISLSGIALVPTKNGVVEAAAQAPGVYFASNITELTKLLDSRNIAYQFSKSKCLSGVDALQDLVKKAVLGVAAAFIALAGILVFVLRKAKTQPAFAQNAPIVQPNYQNGGAVQPVPTKVVPAQQHNQSGGQVVRLDGRSESGARFSLVLSVVQLTSGVVLGRQGSIPAASIDDAAISRMHAALNWRDDNLYVTDQNSMNGTYVNGRQIPPGTEMPLKMGDELKLGTVQLRVGA